MPDAAPALPTSARRGLALRLRIALDSPHDLAGKSNESRSAIAASTPHRVNVRDDSGDGRRVAREAADILARIQAFAGDEDEAVAWYQGQPIPALGARTAEALVKMGQGGAVRHYLDTLSTGGFA